MAKDRSARLPVRGATAVVVLVFVIAPGVADAAGCAAGFQDAGGGVCTATLAYTGAPQALKVPPQVTAITAVVSGAEGGPSLEEQVDPFGGASSPGGKGGRETAVIPIAPGAMLTVVVGQAGTGGDLAPPGFGGYGGGGHATSRYGGNGGGGSYVFDVDGPLIAAGGGGGGGYDYNPVVMGRGDQHAPGGHDSGGAAAGNGQSVPFCCDGTAPYNAGGGGGATPDAPGLGGHPTLPPSYAFGQADGDAGSGPAFDAENFGNGGNTHNGCCYYTGWAGGGGGGYQGGGGGGNIEAHLEGGGGGGGAGYVVPAAISSSTSTGVQSGDGEVTISYYTGNCNVACATCSGPAATQCTSCPNGFMLADGACVAADATSTPTATATDTPIATNTSTPVAPTATSTATSSSVATPTRTPSNTPTGTHTKTPAPPATPTDTAIATATQTPTTSVTADLSRLLAALFEPSPPAEADVNRDGEVTSADVVAFVARLH